MADWKFKEPSKFKSVGRKNKLKLFGFYIAWVKTVVSYNNVTDTIISTVSTSMEVVKTQKLSVRLINTVFNY